MGVNLDDYRALLEDLGPHAGEVLRASWQEAARAFSPRGLDAYLEGARALHALGRGAEPVAAFLHEAPAVAREAGEEAASELLRAALSLSSKTSGGVITLALSAAPTAARRLAARALEHVLALAGDATGGHHRADEQGRNSAGRAGAKFEPGVAKGTSRGYDWHPGCQD